MKSIQTWKPGRFAEGIPMQRVRSAVPATLPALLRTMHLDHSSADAQKVALREWLHDHEPGPALKLSLRENGYGLLLEHHTIGSVGESVHQAGGTGHFS